MKHAIVGSVLLWMLAVAAPVPALAEDPHGHEDAGQAHEAAGGHEAEEGALRMTAAERRAQGIETAPVERRSLADTVTAPGEVRMNAYRTAQVTPRINAQVVARHARLGDRVQTGQPLVTLSGVTMAEAQGALIEADREWQRVKVLGRDVVSDKRYVAAQVARQRAYAAVLAYGMTESQVERLLADGDASRATGDFQLLSPRDGTVIRDDFVLGEVVEPGRVLFEVSDESVLWVEARLQPEHAAEVRVGTAARVSRDGKEWLDGRMVQIHHQLDEATRTRGVRIEVVNRGDRLHAGDYVDAAVTTGEGAPVVAVPEAAVLIVEGAPTVFRLEGDELHPRPVETGPTRAGWTEVRAGLAAGDEVVTRGAFLLKSLLLKSQMGEGHAH